MKTGWSPGEAPNSRAPHYDGTITYGDWPDEALLDAIAALRSRGIVVFLVTGRILTELLSGGRGASLRRCRGRREWRSRALSGQWLHESPCADDSDWRS